MKPYTEIKTEELDKLISENTEANEACDRAMRMITKLCNRIENMSYDCDGEVYETLLKIQKLLNRELS